MAQLTNLALQDGQASPATITFSVVEASPASSVLANRASGISAFFDWLRIRTRMASKQDPFNRGQITVTMPTYGTVGGAQVITGKPGTMDIRVQFPDGWTQAQRNNLYALGINAMNNALVRGAVRDLDYLN